MGEGSRVQGFKSSKGESAGGFLAALGMTMHGSGRVQGFKSSKGESAGRFLAALGMTVRGWRGFVSAWIPYGILPRVLE
jgi:hypothetical protein